MEQINTDLVELNKILNIKYNKNINLNLLKVNTNKKYPINLQLDMIFLEKYIEYFREDLELYNYIFSLPIEKRFKI
jgi:hypothetical protein